MSFLNKKSWHTGGLPMLKKVWAAEEREKQEQRTIEQLRREKAEERALEDSRRLQAQQGLLTSAPSERLEWMYAGQAVSEAVKQESYLLGAAVKESKAADSASVSAAVQAADERWKAGGASAVAGSASSSSSAFDEAARLREDPLLAIMREQHKRAHSAHTRPAPTSMSAAAITATASHSRGKDTERPRQSGSGESDRGADRDRHRKESRGSESRSEGRRTRDDGEEHRGKREREFSSERAHKRSRRRSRSPNSSQSESSDDSERKRRRRRRERRHSGSRSRSSEARTTHSHHNGKKRGREEARDERADADDSKRETAATGADQRRDSEPHTTRAEHVQPTSSSASSPAVVSSAFVSSTSAFGGRLGLILPMGAPLPVQRSTPPPMEDKRQEEEARTVSPPTPSSAHSSAVTPTQLPPRPPVSSLSEAERAARLRAMQSDAESLIVSRRQQAREAVQYQPNSEQSERAVTCTEAEQLSAPVLTSLRKTVIERGRLNNQQLCGSVDGYR